MVDQKRLLKRLMDIAIAVAAIPFAVPVVFVAAVAIRLESRGSPLFRQGRAGKNGQLFTVFKLRTMVQGAQDMGAGIYAEPNDARFTRIGKLARRYSIDELPQLLNVLRGDMSIVGPRPVLPETVQMYPEEYSTILTVRPGLTGLSQVSGRNALPRSRRMAFDMHYARNWSVRGDISIILRTFSVALSGEGQLNTQTERDVEL